MKDRMAKIKSKFNNLSKVRKAEIIIATMLSLTFIIASPVLAWFSYQRSVVTLAKVNSPARLTLKSGHEEDIIQFKISGIDVEQESGNRYADYVFSVEGKDVSNYRLQIAHTTNIKFNYEIYKAVESPNGTVKYLDIDQNTYYYSMAEKLDGAYVNRNNTITERNVGTAGYSAKSYDEGDNRQSFAEPLYWQSDEKNPINPKQSPYNAYADNQSKEKEFLNYYVLHITWDEMKNDKETDIVYITAQVAK